MAKPTLVLVPGSFAVPANYTSITDVLKAEGHDVQAVHLPSVGPAPNQPGPNPPPSMYDDAAYIASHVEKLADEGRDVILLPHSYGGVPTTQSTKGLTKAEREAQGKQGGIVELAYFTVVIPEVEGNCAGVLADVPPESKLEIAMDEGWLYHDNPEATAKVIAQNTSLEEGTQVVKNFPRHSAQTFADPLTHAGWRGVTVSYLLCQQDLCVPPDVQRAEIAMIEKDTGKKVLVTEQPLDHMPPVTNPEPVIEWVRSIFRRYE